MIQAPGEKDSKRLVPNEFREKIAVKRSVTDVNDAWIQRGFVGKEVA